MKVTNIDLQAANTTSVINFSFRDPTNQNPYIVKEIVGLDAEDIIPKFYGTDLSGSKYFDLSLKKRVIVLQLSLNPNFGDNETYSDLRDVVYKLIASSRTGVVELLFKNGLTTKASLSGFIVKVETPKFTKTPEIHLTIECNESMLKAVTEVDIPVVGLNPTNTVITDNESTSPHGFRFAIEFTGTTTEFSIKDASIPTWSFDVDLTGSTAIEFVDGDILYFSSETNNRYLYIARSTFVTHLIDRVQPGSIWPMLFPGDNSFVLSSLAEWNYIKHYPTYWGI